jgi:L-malate glycosyltransferase
MRILLLSNVLSVHTIKWAKALLPNHNIILFSLTAPTADVIKELAGINIVTIGIRNSTAYSEQVFQKLNYLKAIPRVRKIIRDFNPDILHAHYATSYGLIGAMSGFHPYIISVWGSDIYDFPRKSLFHKMLVKYNLRIADIILSTSHIMARHTEKYTDKNVLVTPFGVDLTKFSKNRMLNLRKNSEIVIGTVKTLHKKYGIDYLIRAFKIVVEKNPDKI